jgi:hypothetical protein
MYARPLQPFEEFRQRRFESHHSSFSDTARALPLCILITNDHIRSEYIYPPDSHSSRCLDTRRGPILAYLEM